MKALVFNGPRDIRYESFADPELETNNSAIVKVDRCSICGSDLHMYHGDQIAGADYGAGVAQFCVGHEFAGEVMEVGNGVHKLKVGQKVFACGGAPCGKCLECRSGNVQGCGGWTAFGLSATLNGGQAELVNVPMADFILHPGEAVAVVGLGPIGLIGVELARALGASEVYAIDPVANRRQHAASLGAIALDPAEAEQVIVEQTKGRRIPRVFEASGARSAVQLAVSIAGRGSTASFIGLPQPDVSVPMFEVLFKDVTIRAGVASVYGQWPNLIPLLQHGRVKAEGLFSHHMDLADGAEAYRLFDAREDNVVKIMMTL